MDAVQFGRWLADRRRVCGWASQRALALAAQAHPHTSSLTISEAFLARLEAGLLVHPFRGAVRRRVVGLAWLLCSSARQVRDYVKLAELSSPSRAEASEIESLVRSLSDAHAPHSVILPPPPAYFVGRSDELATLTAALTQMRGGCSVITGMPGIGKTSLALAAAHQLVAGSQRPAPFSDGVSFITCTGRHGPHGARSILEDVLALQQPHDRADAPRLHSAGAHAANDVDGSDAAEGALARIADHARQVLAGKRVLVVLDDIESDLPLDSVLDALLPHSFAIMPASSTLPETLTAPVLLITGRYLPRISPRVYHLRLRPLALEDGVRLIEHVVGRSLDGDDREAALRLCAAVGAIPLALDAAATLAQTGIPLAMLAGAAKRNPLAILGGTGASAAADAITRSLDALPGETRARLALLSVLQAESFGLGAVAALHPEVPGGAVMVAGDLVQRSLLERERPAALEMTGHADAGTVPDTRFRLSPLLRAYAAEQAQALPPATIDSARRHLAAYANAYIERYGDDTQALASEAAVLRAALRYAIQDGEHERVVRLVTGLLPVAMQRDTCGRIERLVLAGIRASKAIADRTTFMRLLNCLGVMRFYQGDSPGARRVWALCIQLADDLRAPNVHHGIAYLNLGQLADLEGEPDAAWHLGELGVHYSRKAGIATAVSGALSMQAERARRRGEHHVAHAYARESLDLATAAAIEQTACSHRHVYLIEARLAMARIERNAAVAGEYADQYLALTDTQHRLFIAEALIDQAEYSLDENTKQEAMKLAAHALAVANDAGASSLAQRATALHWRAEQPPRSWRNRAAGA